MDKRAVTMGLVLGMLVQGLPFVGGLATAEPLPCDTTFTDDFDADTRGPAWSPGSLDVYSQRDGRVVIQGDFVAGSDFFANRGELVLDRSCRNYRVTYAAGNNHPPDSELNPRVGGLTLRYDGPGDLIALTGYTTIRPDPFKFRGTADVTGELQIEFQRQEGWHAVQYEARAQGNSYSVYGDGVLLLQFTDPSSDFLDGKMGLYWQSGSLLAHHDLWWDDFQVGPFDVPGAPTNLAANAGPGAGEIGLSWNAPAADGGTPVTHYEVYRGTASGAETFLAETGTATSYTDTGIPNGATRYYKVSAKNLAGEGPLSNEASAHALLGVQIDIHPGSFPNSINPNSHGRTPVAILSTASFDAPTQVNRTSPTFGRAGSEASLASCNGAGEDVNADGLLDLVCHFRTRDAHFQQGDTLGRLRGHTTFGAPFTGSDSVNIVP